MEMFDDSISQSELMTDEETRDSQIYQNDYGVEYVQAENRSFIQK